MSEEIEKIYCSRETNIMPMLSELLANVNKGPDAASIMAMKGSNNDGMSQWMNNPWIYFVFLALFGNGNLFGRNNGNEYRQQTQNEERLLGIENQIGKMAEAVNVILGKIKEAEMSHHEN